MGHPRLARLHAGSTPPRAVALGGQSAAAHELLAIAAHNDAIMLALALLGTYAAAVQRNWKGGLIGTTLVTLWRPSNPSPWCSCPSWACCGRAGTPAGPASSWRGPSTLAYSVVLLAVMGLVSGFGFGWVSAASSWHGVHLVRALRAARLFAQLVGTRGASTAPRG
ncbi:hypothetical protein QJS66_05185 [Kocuria rhizophila]|nr:hypothetical protein QJS66_05185 [Kocuria rhizophila]